MSEVQEALSPDADSAQNMRKNYLGIVALISGLCIAAGTGAIMKLLSADLSSFQITWFRFTGFALMMAPVMIWKFRAVVLRPARPGIQFVRGLTMAAGTVAFVVGARTIDFADAIAILYAYPFLLTVLAVLFLGERVHPVAWLGVFGGFVGVLLVMRPEFRTVNAGSLFVFLCAVIVSVQMVMNRKLGSVSHPLVTSFWGALVAAVALSCVAPFHWDDVGREHGMLLLLLIVSGAVSQILIVFAFSQAEASVLAPFSYFEIIAAVLIGWFVFGTLPVWLSALGIVLILVSGILVARALRGRHSPRRHPKF